MGIQPPVLNHVHPVAQPAHLPSSPASTAALVSERVNGYGLIAQLELDFPGIQPLLLGVAALLAVAAFWPAQ